MTESFEEVSSVRRCEDSRGCSYSGPRLPPVLKKGALPASLVVLVLCGTDAIAHVGLRSFVAYEIADTTAIDLFDGSLSDWRTFAPGPSILGSEFHGYSTEGGPFKEHDVTDLDFEVWLAWRGQPPRVYVGLSRSDDLHVPGPSETSFEYWLYDGWSFMIDGDHSGGAYDLLGASDPRQMREAQGYVVMLDSLGALHRRIWLRERWPTASPFSTGGGALGGDGSAVYEFYVTPFDTLKHDDAATSRRSELVPGKVIGIGMIMYDTDKEWTQPDTVYTLSPSVLNAERYAEYFVDLELLPADVGSTVTRTQSWGALKKSSRKGR